MGVVGQISIETAHRASLWPRSTPWQKATSGDSNGTGAEQ